MRREAGGLPRRIARAILDIASIGGRFEYGMPNDLPARRRQYPEAQAPKPALLAASRLRNAPDARDTKGIGRVLFGAQRAVELLKQDRHQSGADQGDDHGRWKKQKRIERARK